MVVFSMDSKRIRRPSVRLREVGDPSAAFNCGFSKLNNGSTRRRRWKNDCSDHVQESKNLQIALQKQPEYTNLDPCVSPRIFEDSQHNTENRDPNSSNLESKYAISDAKIKSDPKLDFGTITRRSRVMKRKRRSPDSISSVFFPWKLEPVCETVDESEKGYRLNQVVGCTLDSGFNTFHANGFNDLLEDETSATSEDANGNECDDPNSSAMKLPRPNETWSEDTWSEENATIPQSTSGHNNKLSSDSTVNSVGQWLEELGFGKFANLFEIHEVDEETLPLLTFEDLKDMGIDAVGPRLRLFNAIQHLRRK